MSIANDVNDAVFIIYLVLYNLLLNDFTYV